MRRRRREDPPEGCHFLQQSVNFIFILVQLQERTENKADIYSAQHYTRALNTILPLLPSTP